MISRRRTLKYLYYTKAKRRWHPYSTRQASHLPKKWRYWLTTSRSLTACLQQVAENSFQVKILKEHWGKPAKAEASALNISPYHWVWIREVLLCGKKQAWVYARTIIPRATICANPALLHLKQQPIGPYLFKQAHILRSALEITQTPFPPVLQSQLSMKKKAGNFLWSRRSIFSIKNQPLLIAEHFLPQLPYYPEE